MLKKSSDITARRDTYSVVMSTERYKRNNSAKIKLLDRFTTFKSRFPEEMSSGKAVLTLDVRELIYAV